MLAAVPSCAGQCRFVRGFSVGIAAADAELWGFCGDARRPGLTIAAAAEPGLQAYAVANDYIPLPAQIQQLARTMLQQITGPTGTHLLS
jgi:hypothetical protein